MLERCYRRGNKKCKLESRGYKNANFKAGAVTKNANFKVEVTHAKQSQRCEKEPHAMFVIVVLILRASAIAMPPSVPMKFDPKLKKGGGNKNGMIGMLLPSR
jgi:hypothetical protein